MDGQSGRFGAAFAAAALGAASASAAAQSCDRGAAEAELRARHQAVIGHHLSGDVEAWLAGETDEVIVGFGGDVFVSAREDRRARRADYLGRNVYSRYEDTVAPVVEIAGDCSIAWLIAAVAVAGEARRDDGSMEPFAFRSSWIELYKRIDGEWKMVGNVSDVVPE
ncbi:MAG: hypothetical protein Tsb0010_06320 [Parvularculaceae bacterium]